MDFCSNYGYDYGFDGSDEEDFLLEEGLKKIQTKSRQADTNIIAVKFDELVSANEMFAGEPKRCNTCAAIMSALSEKNVQKENDKFIWKCEFCDTVNDMSAVLEDLNELPKVNDVTFLIEPPKQKVTAATAEPTRVGETGADQLLTFCIDVSGSMNDRIPIKKEENEVVTQNRSTMTRLEGVKVASMETLSKLKDDEPNKQVSLITFSDNVKYFGDCTRIRNNQPLFHMHDRNYLNNKERIQSEAYNMEGDVKEIAQSYPNIEQRIKNLKTEGSTALGPALYFSIVNASKKPGSSVILCTDGCANVGVGSIERANDVQEGEKFYDEVADYAKEKGVIVNVITMEGTDCKLALLGRVADRSNGAMNIVNPLNLSNEFMSILKNRLVATNVEARLIVHQKYLYIRDEQLEAEEAKAAENNDTKAKKELYKKRQSVVVKEIGNANIDTEITFEYGIRKIENKEERPAALKEMPFQLQITYTGTDGSKAIRVYTKLQKFTKNRHEAEREISSRDLLFMHKAQYTSSHVTSKCNIASKMKNDAYANMYCRNQWNHHAHERQHHDKMKLMSLEEDYCFYTDKLSSELYREKKISRMKMEKLGLISKNEEQKPTITVPTIQQSTLTVTEPPVQQPANDQPPIQSSSVQLTVDEISDPVQTTTDATIVPVPSVDAQVEKKKNDETEDKNVQN